MSFKFKPSNSFTTKTPVILRGMTLTNYKNAIVYDTIVIVIFLIAYFFTDEEYFLWYALGLFSAITTLVCYTREMNGQEEVTTIVEDEK